MKDLTTVCVDNLRHERIHLEKYKFNFSLIINVRYKSSMLNHWLKPLCDANNDQVCEIRIVDNLVLNAFNQTIIELLFQHGGMNADSHWRGVFVNICCKTLSGCKRLMKLFHFNSMYKKEKILIQDEFNLNLSMAIDNFIEQVATPISSIEEMHEWKYFSTEITDFNPTLYFNPMGHFTLTDGFLKLISLKEVPAMENYLPIVTFDIETIAMNLTTVPTGVLLSEKLSSLVLLVDFMGVFMVYGFYLSDLPFKECDDAFRREFIRKYSDSYGTFKTNTPKIIFKLNTYYTEREMLTDFMDYYAGGKIFLGFDLSAEYPHIIQGHNIIDYDFPFIVNRLKIYNMETYYNRYVKIDKLGKQDGKCLPTYRLHKNSICFDLYKVVKRNMPGMKMSLKGISAHYLPEKDRKNDLNSVDIRKFYIMGETKTPESINELKKFFIVHDHGKQLPYNSDKKQIIYNALDFPYITYNSQHFKDNMLAKNLTTPSLENIMVYNIMDCITVAEIFKCGNFYNLFNIFMTLFFTDIETSSMSGNATRLKTCQENFAIKYNQFLGRRKQDDFIIHVKYISEFNLGNFTNVKIFQPFQFKDGKKKYDGAFNYANKGVHFNIASMDVASYYPNLLRFMSMSYNRLAVITVAEIKQIPDCSLWFQKYISTGIFTIVNSLPPRDNDNNETTAYLRLDYNGPEIGEIITTYEHLQRIPDETMLFINLEHAVSDSSCDLVSEILNERVKFKNALKMTKKTIAQLKTDNREAEIEKYQKMAMKFDANQLALKIIANSFYGVNGTNLYKHSHIPTSAYIALLGRKYLTLMARLIQYINYDELLKIEEAKPASEKRPVCTLLGEEITRDWLESCMKHLNRMFAFKNEPGLKYSAHIQPSTISLDSDIVYIDTDGIYYKARVSSQLVTKRVNEYLYERLGTSTIVMEDEGTNSMAMVLMCKTYSLVNESNGVLKIKHNGYEKNAIKPVKDIFNYIAKLVYISNTEENIYIYPIHLMLDIYSFLLGQNPFILSTKIQLNRHKNLDTALARYICSQTTTFTGNIETMLILDPNNLTADNYMSKSIWLQKLASGIDVTLHLEKTIRIYFKIFLRMIFFMKLMPEVDVKLRENEETVFKKVKNFNDEIFRLFIEERWSKISNVKAFDHYQQPETLSSSYTFLKLLYEIEKKNVQKFSYYKAQHVIDEGDEIVLAKRDLKLTVHYPIALNQLPNV